MTPHLFLEDYGRGQTPPLQMNVVARFILALWAVAQQIGQPRLISQATTKNWRR